MNELQHESPTCTAIACTKGITEAEFRALRLLGLGGSDAGGIMDMSGYKSTMLVVADKLELTKYEDNKATKRGKRMEPVIREKFAEWAAEIDGVPVEVFEVFESPWVYRHNECPWMLANIDGLVRHKDHGMCVLEIKTADARLEGDWKNDSIPDSYYAQVQHYMFVLGLNMALVGVMIGLDFELRYIPRNEEFIADMVERERVVWHDFVLKKLLPDPSGIDKENELLLDLYSDPKNESVDLAEFKDKAERHVYLNAEIKAMDTEKKEIAGFFKMKLSNAKRGLVPGYNVAWSRFKMKKFDQERFEKENPEIAAKYTTQEDSGRFTITAKKEK